MKCYANSKKVLGMSQNGTLVLIDWADYYPYIHRTEYGHAGALMVFWNSLATWLGCRNKTIKVDVAFEVLEKSAKEEITAKYKCDEKIGCSGESGKVDKFVRQFK